MTCAVCGYEVAAGAGKCPRCGRLHSAPPPAWTVPQQAISQTPPLPKKPLPLAPLAGATALVFLIAVIVFAVHRYARVAAPQASPGSPVAISQTSAAPPLPYAELHGPPPQVAELQQPSGSTGSAGSPQAFPDLPRVSVDDLAKAFGGDYISVTAYDGQRFVVTGKVGTCGTQAGSPYIGLFPSSGQEVLCVFPPGTPLAMEYQGTPIAIAGRCDGSTMGTITLSGCALAKQ